ncbi:MAG TPA: hypothetical protein VHI71_10850 [Actinomycetota bacterium]|nr:hypothetical protein [Actinomycetota bacterium]
MERDGPLVRLRDMTLASLLLAGVLAAGAQTAPRALPPPQAPAGVHPKAVEQVAYHFEVETEGLPVHMWKPGPRAIDVRYRDLDSGRLVTLRGVGPNWMRLFEWPEFSRGRVEAVARGGGLMWCVVEVYFADASGWTVTDRGRHRCRLKRRF